MCQGVRRTDCLRYDPHRSLQRCRNCPSSSPGCGRGSGGTCDQRKPLGSWRQIGANERREQMLPDGTSFARCRHLHFISLVPARRRCAARSAFRFSQALSEHCKWIYSGGKGLTFGRILSNDWTKSCLLLVGFFVCFFSAFLNPARGERRWMMSD